MTDQTPPYELSATKLDHAIVLGTLINQSGRQRMLSHRAVMFIGLIRDDTAEAKRGEFLVSARKALADFSRGRTLLIEGDEALGLPRLFSSRAKSVLDTPFKGITTDLSGLHLIDLFIDKVASCIRQFETNERDAYKGLLVLADLASGPILEIHNRLVAAFEHDLGDAQKSELSRAMEVRRMIETTTTNIEKLGLNINMIALSAIVEAARAGETGKSFAFLANEIKNLGTQTRAESSKIGIAVHKLFGAQG